MRRIRPALPGFVGTTAFRLALTNAVVFGLATAVVFVLLFAWARTRVVAQLDSSIALDRRSLVGTFEDQGPAALTAAVERQVESANEGQDFYLLRDAQSHRIAGNLPPTIPTQTGLFWAQVSGGDADESNMLRIEAQTLPNGWQLLVARNPERLADLEQIFIDGLVWTEVGIFVLGLGLGTLAGRRVLRGVALISEEAQRIGAGELSRRIPEIPGGGEIARIGQAVNLMLDRIGALTDRLRQVTDDVAHDLRTPLGRLRQGLERSARHADDAAALHAGIEHALVETDAIIGTFNALLRIAQIEAQERKAGFMPVDPSTLLIRLADIYRPAIEDSGHVLAVEATPELSIEGDVSLLEQMIANLIENALRHTPPGSCIRLSTAHEGSGVVVAVADDGPGIPLEARESVLRRFVRLDQSRGTPGSGLGLALVKAVADLHRASLRLKDAHPGLRVEVRFPPPGKSDRRT